MNHPIPMLDLMFFLTETQDNPRHVGSVLIFRKPRRGGAHCVQQIVDAYRRAAPQPPFDRIPVFRKTGLPVWLEVVAIDPLRHVLHLVLPLPAMKRVAHARGAPGGREHGAPHRGGLRCPARLDYFRNSRVPLASPACQESASCPAR